MKILICTEVVEGKVAPVSRQLVTAARSLLRDQPGEVIAFGTGSSVSGFTATLGGVDRGVFCEDGSAALVPAHRYGEAVLSAIAAERPDLILLPYSANGLDVAPFLAARLDMPLVSYAVAMAVVTGGLEVTAEIYGGKVSARTFTPLPAIVMINPGSFEEAEPTDLTPDRVSSIAPVDVRGIELEALEFPNFAEVNLALAEKIVCVGRGIGDEASIEQARELAGLLGAELAGSRPVVDRGWLPKLRQVGKSGQTVKPRLYLALGVSGAPEHLEGMSKSEVIIAVNTDPNAPIFNTAHYGATCDLFDLIEALSARLHNAKPG